MGELKVLKKEDLDNLKSGMKLAGVLLIQGYSEATTKTGKPYFTGTLQSESSVGFKCWSNSEAFSKLSMEDYRGVVSYVEGDVQDYQGSISVVVTNVLAVSGYDASMFLKKRYNSDAYWNGLRSNYLAKYVSTKGQAIFDKIFTEDVVSRFTQEFAAMSHHDNCVGGLLAHTYKVAMFGEVMLRLYPKLFIKVGESEVSQDKVDLFMLGIFMHDIGKIMEMNNGVYQPCSRVTHRILGIELIQSCRQDIVDAYGETWYYDLVSILVQHHDEFDDKARTVMAQLVFMCDLMESRCMGIQQELEEKVQGTGDDARIFFDGKYLYC